MHARRELTVEPDAQTVGEARAFGDTAHLPTDVGALYGRVVDLRPTGGRDKELIGSRSRIVPGIAQVASSGGHVHALHRRIPRHGVLLIQIGRIDQGDHQPIAAGNQHPIRSKHAPTRIDNGMNASPVQWQNTADIGYDDIGRFRHPRAF